MGNFCKGAFFGVVAGTVVGAIIIAKNKNLACKLNKGLTVAEDKIKEVKQDIEEKISNSNDKSVQSCDCEPVCDCDKTK